MSILISRDAQLQYERPVLDPGGVIPPTDPGTGAPITPSQEAQAISLLNRAVIGHDSFTINAGNLNASSQSASFPASGLLNPLTYERWKPLSLPAYVYIDLNTNAATADYVGIAAHNLGSMRATAQVWYSITGSAGSFVKIHEWSPSDNSPIMLMFNPVNARYWRIDILSADAIPYIGVLYIGKALVMQRNIYSGVTPPAFNRDTKVITNRSDTGQTLGRTVIRSGLQQSFKWAHLTRDWVDVNIPPFLRNARERAFFVAWRPYTHPNDVVFGELEDDPKLSNTGPRNFMDMSFSMRGVVNE